MSARRANATPPPQPDSGSSPPTAVRPLCCPLESAISPHADDAQRWLAQWLQTHGPVWDAERRRRFERIGFARYAARLYPEAEPTTLQAVSGLFAWFFLLDDAADSARTPDTARLRSTLTRALAVLRRPPPTAVPQDRDVDQTRLPDLPSLPDLHSLPDLPSLLAEAWRAPHAVMPQGWRDRFVDAVQHHLDGVLLEAEAKSVGRRPGVEAYVRLRRATSAAYVAHVLTEFAVRAPLPDTVHGHPAVRAYSTAGNDLLSWFNDLLSLERDEATGGGHNLVLALAAEHQVSTAEAVELAVTRWQQLMDSLAELRAAVPSFGPELDTSVEHYLNGVDRSVRGTIDWSLETIRYQPPPLIAAYLSGSAAN